MIEIEDQIINKVANSGLITIDLEDFIPKSENVVYDLKQNLFRDMILREKDFREFIKAHDWDQYSGKMWLLHVLKMYLYQPGPICF